jgi:hypothetical protein
LASKIRGIGFGLAFYLVGTRTSTALCIVYSLFIPSARAHFVEVLHWSTEGIAFPANAFFTPAELHDFNIRRLLAHR